MRKLSLPVTIVMVICMLFAAAIPSVSAQDGADCEIFEDSYVDAGTFLPLPIFSLLGQNQTVTVTSPTDPNKAVLIMRYDLVTMELISETTSMLPLTFSTANDSLQVILLFTEDGSSIIWYTTISCGEELLSCPIDDGRLDTSDCGALVAAYPNGTALDIYGIDPASGEGVLVFSFDLATAGDVTENTLLAEGTNPFNGQPIRLYKLAGGGYQLNSTQPNGEPYEFAWS
jgi:hypothetical protein